MLTSEWLKDKEWGGRRTWTYNVYFLFVCGLYKDAVKSWCHMKSISALLKGENVEGSSQSLIPGTNMSFVWKEW
jgi:hypothetical protein